MKINFTSKKMEKKEINWFILDIILYGLMTIIWKQFSVAFALIMIILFLRGTTIEVVK